MTISVGILLPFLPLNIQNTVIGLRPPILVQILAEEERVAVDDARLGEKNRLALVEPVAPTIESTQIFKASRCEIGIKGQSRNGLLDQTRREIPCVEAIERRHLLPGHVRFAPNAFPQRPNLA